MVASSISNVRKVVLLVLGEMHPMVVYLLGSRALEFPIVIFREYVIQRDMQNIMLQKLDLLPISEFFNGPIGTGGLLNKYSELWYQVLSTSMKLGAREIAHVEGVSRVDKSLSHKLNCKPPFMVAITPLTVSPFTERDILTAASD